mmetsp:Transcript_21635/g.45173  ORF Transcript_21635/g.45173 Transcript_21635/m.45173 type:complete len:270 (-) Transcript_21635:840-1649(-)
MVPDTLALSPLKMTRHLLLADRGKALGMSNLARNLMQSWRKLTGARGPGTTRMERCVSLQRPSTAFALSKNNMAKTMYISTPSTIRLLLPFWGGKILGTIVVKHFGSATWKRCQNQFCKASQILCINIGFCTNGRRVTLWRSITNLSCTAGTHLRGPERSLRRFGGLLLRIQPSTSQTRYLPNWAINHSTQRTRLFLDSGRSQRTSVPMFATMQSRLGIAAWIALVITVMKERWERVLPVRSETAFVREKTSLLRASCGIHSTRRSMSP